MRGELRPIVGLAMGLALLSLGAVARAQSAATPEHPPEVTAEAPDARPCSVKAENVDLTCYPGQIWPGEKRWTFFVRGPRAFSIDAAKLYSRGTGVAAMRISAPTPRAVLIDFEYPPIELGTTVQLSVEAEGKELARFPIAVTAATDVRAEFRQQHLVRLQTRPYMLTYPLHGSMANDPVKDRRLDELTGDREFIGLLKELGIERIRKVIPRYAEGDTVHWNERLAREDILGSKELRQYLIYLDPDRSEAAFKELFKAFPQVEASFINVDRAKMKAQ